MNIFWTFWKGRFYVIDYNTLEIIYIFLLQQGKTLRQGSLLKFETYFICPIINLDFSLWESASHLEDTHAALWRPMRRGTGTSCQQLSFINLPVIGMATLEMDPLVKLLGDYSLVWHLDRNLLGDTSQNHFQILSPLAKPSQTTPKFLVHRTLCKRK